MGSEELQAPSPARKLDQVVTVPRMTSVIALPVPAQTRSGFQAGQAAAYGGTHDPDSGGFADGRGTDRSLEAVLNSY
jgi:hypothetical protein